MESPLPHRVVAIDGPAASGKSTVARLVAKRLGYLYVNTGAMYRAVTWLALQRGVSPSDAQAVGSMLESASMEFDMEGDEGTIRMDGIDPSAHLNDPEVASHVAAIAAIPKVREVLVARQREYARQADLVMEGRDIGSVVFPDTPLKFYIDASEEVRAKRRSDQGLRDDLAARDKKDSTRADAPLKKATGAHVIDSTCLTIEGVVEEILRRIK